MKKSVVLVALLIFITGCNTFKQVSRQQSLSITKNEVETSKSTATKVQAESTGVIETVSRTICYADTGVTLGGSTINSSKPYAVLVGGDTISSENETVKGLIFMDTVTKMVTFELVQKPVKVHFQYNKTVDTRQISTTTNQLTEHTTSNMANNQRTEESIKNSVVVKNIKSSRALWVFPVVLCILMGILIFFKLKNRIL